MKILTDFHHSSLLKSLRLLLENRMGFELYRPIGMDWFTEGYWKINDQQDTAKQYLDLDQGFRPIDGTPPLNLFLNPERPILQDAYYCFDPGNISAHKACTLEYFKENQFDLLIASIPAHIEPFKELIRLYQPNAKLIVQVGNNWRIEEYQGMNVLASIMPRTVSGVNVCFYHQEIDRRYFSPAEVSPNGQISSYVNILGNTGIGWNDFLMLEQMTAGRCEWRSFGGQCRDGNKTGDRELSNSMKEDMLVYHVKPGGDGFGHVLHDAYACGRVVITRSSHYKDQLGSLLFDPETYIDLDEFSRDEVMRLIYDLMDRPEVLTQMSSRAAARFQEVVNYDEITERVGKWINTLI